MAASFSTPEGRQKEWHTGQDLPDFIGTSRVLQIILDGDELDWFLHKVISPANTAASGLKVTGGSMKEGDVVYLKSGGPALTVVSLQQSNTEAVVAWIHEGYATKERFPITCLQIDNPNQRREI